MSVPSIPNSIITLESLRQHAAPAAQLWISVGGNVYDVTSYVSSHPGGAAILKRFCGSDATVMFDKYHARHLIEDAQYRPEQVRLIGRLEKGPESSTPVSPSREGQKTTKESADSETNTTPQPSLESIINNSEFIPFAKKNMSSHGWIYYATGAEDELTLAQNRRVFQTLLWRPRVCVDVSDIHCEATILGVACRMPLFLCATARQALVASPGAEVTVCRNALMNGVIPMVSTFSSRPLKDIVAACKDTARAAGLPLFLQLYVHSDRERTRKLLAEVASYGTLFRAVFITVDAPSLGRREADMRQQVVPAGNELINGALLQQYGAPTSPTAAAPAPTWKERRRGGIAGTLTSQIAKNFTWKDVVEIRNMLPPHIKIVLKGVQRGEDAVIAARLGCVDGLLLSNHGGRQVDTAVTGVDALEDVHRCLSRYPSLKNALELYVDGGIWRGSDVAKCIALGARAVGVGRAPLFALAGFGEAGMTKCLETYEAELHNVMALVGARDLKELQTGKFLLRRAGDVLQPPPCTLSKM